MDIGNYERDPQVVDGGVWIDEIPNHGDLRLKVRGLSSTLANAIRNRKERRAGPEDREKDGSLKPDAIFRFFCETLHEAVLLDWENLTNKGEPIPYTPEAAKEYCTDKRFAPFANAVTVAADIVDRGRVANQDMLAKN